MGRCDNSFEKTILFLSHIYEHYLIGIEISKNMASQQFLLSKGNRIHEMAVPLRSAISLREKILEYVTAKWSMTVDMAEELSQNILEEVQKELPELKMQATKEIWPRVVNIVEREYDKLRTSMSKNFGLTESSFQQMTEALRHGDRSIFEQTFLTHFGDCMQYLKSTYRASHEDAYDATMDAMLEFCKRLESGKISFGNLRFLFTRMAGQIYFRQQKKQWPSEELDQDIPVPEENTYSKEELMILEKVVDELCTDCKEIIKAFYYHDISLKDLAERYQKSSAALRKQKQRCVEKLRTLFKKYSQ